VNGQVLSGWSGLCDHRRRFGGWAGDLDGVDGPRSRHRCAITWSSVNATMRGAVHHADYHHRFDLDLAKHWFQVHGVEAVDALSFAGGCGGAV